MELSHRAHGLRVSIITLRELAAGVATVAELQRLLSGISVLMLPRQLARRANRLRHQLTDALGLVVVSY